MRISFLVTFFFVIHLFFSQENGLESKNHYTFSLVNGINRNSTKVEFGELSPENATSLVHGFNFQYTRIFHPKFSVATGIGFGFLPININVDSYENYPGTDNYFGGWYSRWSFKPFSRLEFSGAYHQQINDKIELKYNLGMGLFYFGSSSFGSMFVSQDTLGQIFNVYDVDVFFDNKAKPFLTFGIEATKKLKNKDLLSFKLSIDHSFSDIYTGTYSVYDGNSMGQFFNRGSFINFNFGYVLTGNKKRNRIKELQSQHQVDPKKARKLLKKVSRFIDPKSSFLNISGGVGFGSTKVHSDPNGNLANGAYSSFLPRISFEKGIKNNFYWEIGVHSQLFWDVTKFNFDKFSSSGSGVFYAVQFSGGGLYRWILKNNYNVLNIHSGFTIGFHGEKNSEDGIHSFGSGTISGIYNDIPISYSFAQVSSVQSNVLSSCYVGLSKDFRIVNNFYLTLNYRRQFGFYKVYESTYNYSGSNIPTTTGAKTKLTGSSNDFQFGFKIKLK